jgi:tetratricopeptide (TPR) repeat protein
MVQRVADSADEPRFAMLEMIRAYALERLEASGTAEQVRRQHAACFMELAEAAMRQFHTPGQQAWLDQLATESDNVRAALAWALSAAPTIGLRLAYAMSIFWFVRSQFSEGQDWLAQALARRVGTPESAQARVLLATGLLGLMQNASAEAEAALDEGLALFRELGDQQGCAESLLYLALFALRQADPARARALAEEALQLALGLPARSDTALAEMILGSTALHAGEADRADQHFRESLALSYTLGDQWFVGTNLLNLGRVAQLRGADQQARQLLEEALAILRSVPALWTVGETLHELGRVAQRTGDVARAVALYQESLLLTREIGNTTNLPDCFERLASALVERQDPARAARLLGAASALRAAHGMLRSASSHAEFGRTLAAARGLLGEAAFVEAWEAGGAMSLDAAVALAGEAG